MRYTGPTKITFDENSGTSMTVDSPNTTLPMPGGCGTGTVPIPLDKVLYVQAVPAGSTEVACTTPTGNLSPRNPVGYPVAGDITTYDCRAGDLFVQGGIARALTLASEGRTIITGNLDAWDNLQLDTVLGIVAGTDIEMYHPVAYNAATGQYDNLLPSPHKDVHGVALLALNGSFLTQNYDKGAHLGSTYIRGSIAQKWRGLMGTTDGQHGYSKNYFFDPRLRKRLPPFWLGSPGASWQVVGSTG